MKDMAITGRIHYVVEIKEDDLHGFFFFIRLILLAEIWRYMSIGDKHFLSLPFLFNSPTPV